MIQFPAIQSSSDPWSYQHSLEYHARTRRARFISLFALRIGVYYLRNERLFVRHSRQAMRACFEVDERFTNDECLTLFRFGSQSLRDLTLALRFPEHAVLDNGCRAVGKVVLCLMLRYLAYPTRYDDMTHLFDIDATVICKFVIWAVDHIYNNSAQRLLGFDNRHMTHDRLRVFQDAILRRSGIAQCFGFLDGTVRRICRPVRHANSCYTGHKKVHFLGVFCLMYLTPRRFML